MFHFKEIMLQILEANKISNPVASILIMTISISENSIDEICW